jgi:hypothetical protein
MRLHGIPWSSMRSYNVPVNRSVPTEANRGLTSYKKLHKLQIAEEKRVTKEAAKMECGRVKAQKAD